MGYFTWTDAAKEPRRKRDGTIFQTDKIAYGGYAKVVCPDNTAIEEQSYEGYGIFNGQDVYELVVDWNKDALGQIFDELTKIKAWGYQLAPVAKAYQENGSEAAHAAAEQLSMEYLYNVSEDWKHDVGIAIATAKIDRKPICPFPIKITKNRRKVKYENLVPSELCQ